MRTILRHRPTFGETQLVATIYPDWIQQTEWGADYDTERISTIAAIVMPIIWYLLGNISGLITPFIIIGGALFTLTYIPEIIATVWTLRQERHEPKELHTRGVARIGVWISIIGTFIIVAGVLLLGVL